MKRVWILRLCAALGAGGVVASCATYAQPASGVVYVTRQPPGEPVEVIPTSPGFNYVWVGGHWGWYGNDYRWVRGGWVIPAAGFRTWVPGHWDHDGHGWYFVSGHWR